MSRQLFIEWNPQIMYNHHQTGPHRHRDGRAAVSAIRRTTRSIPPSSRGLDLVGAALNTASCSRTSRGSRSAQRLELLDVVERWPAHDGVLPQHDRHAHRNDRQPDADACFARARTSVALRRPAAADRAAGMAFPPVGRLLGDAPTGVARSRVDAIASSSCSTAGRWAPTRSTKGKKDSWTISPKPSTRWPRRSRRIAQQSRLTGSAQRRPWRRQPDERNGRRRVHGAAQEAGGSRSARVHPEQRAARFPDGHEVRAGAAEVGRRRASRDRRSSATNGKTYPAGSWVIQTAQAFRSHVLDMFEPQDHPNDFRFPGGPPIRRTTTRDGRSRSRWAWSTHASWAT